MVPFNPPPPPPSSECSSSFTKITISHSLFATMSVNSVSKTETPPPSPQPQPKQPSLIFSANAVSHFPSFRRPNPNHQTLGDYGLSVGPGGFRFADSGSNDSFDAEAELSGDEEEQSNLMKNLNNNEDEEEGKKTLNLRPRKEKKVLNSRTQNDGGGSRSAPGAAATLPRMPVFSLSLTKAEIEEDFLKMTGELPPKKPQRRTKNVQKQMDGIFPGMSLDNVTPETYKVPDPPLKR